MVNRYSRIKEALERAFCPLQIQIEDESHQHSGPKSETHFKVLIVSDQFMNKTRIERQRMVYDCLKDELQAGLHALTLKTLTADEWNSQQGSLIFESPACRGGSQIRNQK